MVRTLFSFSFSNLTQRFFLFQSGNKSVKCSFHSQRCHDQGTIIFFSCLWQHPPNNGILYSKYFYRGTRLAQWWELSPPTNMAHVLILASTPCVVGVCCWFSLSHLLKNQHLQIPIQSWTHGQDSRSSRELLSAPWVNKLQLITITFKV